MKVLVINPGATSTKVAVFEEEQELLKKSIVHTAQELEGFDRVIDQADFRQRAVLEAVAEGGFRLEDFDAVCGRGGLYRPIPSGTYAVSDRVMQDVEQAPYGEHPSNLGAYLARRIGDLVGIPAFFVDPVCVDEMTEVAHVSGFAEFRRLSQFHALNQKSVAARRPAGWASPTRRLGSSSAIWAVACPWRPMTMAVWWTCSTSRMRGPWAMDRGGGLPVNQLIDYCYAGRSREEVKRTLGRRSGMLSYVGTTDFREICARVVSGDERFTAAYRALVYQLAKDIGAMAAVLHFEVDAIVYTGGMAYEQFFCDDITAYVGRLAPVLRFPGEEEMRALAEGALRVLHGEAQAETY